MQQAEKEKTAGMAVPTVALRAALAYVQYLKWPTIPLHTIINGKCTCFNSKCPSPGKHPRTNNGIKSATTDIRIIKEWFTKWPKSNIGIATGKESGFFALDIDPKHHGDETLEHLIDQYGPLPDTVQAITGGGGSHYLFKYHEGVGNKTDLFQGIDIRGDGGYVVAAPSLHISGNHYEWELSSRPIENEIAEAPRWLLDHLIKPKEERIQPKPSSHWESIMQGVEEGNRNNAAAQLVGHLLRRYVHPRLVVEIMNLWNSERNRPPIDQCELDKIINSIAGKELARRRGGKH